MLLAGFHAIPGFLRRRFCLRRADVPSLFSLILFERLRRGVIFNFMGLFVDFLAFVVLLCFFLQNVRLVPFATLHEVIFLHLF